MKRYDAPSRTILRTDRDHASNRPHSLQSGGGTHFVLSIRGCTAIVKIVRDHGKEDVGRLHGSSEGVSACQRLCVHVVGDIYL
ncbi:MAG: hypothetical protein A2289_12910 [Deltaproteobacteria bacterium RIFOXYA12_FULL_58_15]|nr:MAG: hypothetical protein A2289_12910 [Deltaproteobacteria bacterium RIFOXYA12_FULL_58_15]